MSLFDEIRTMIPRPKLGPFLDQKMGAGWFPAGYHAWRGVDGAVLFHRLHFIRPKHLAAEGELTSSHLSFHAQGTEAVHGEPLHPPEGRPLFHLPQLHAADPAAPIFVVEDESIAIALSGIGLTATTNAGAEAHPDATDWSPLRNRRLRFWPSATPAVERRQREQIRHLRRHFNCGIEVLHAPAEPVPIPLQPFSAKPKGYGPGGLVQAQAWRPPASVGSSFATIRAAEVNAESVRWLWPGRIALGKLTLIAGDPGLGKSILTVDLAARVTRGTPWPVDGSACPQGEVLMLSSEDDAADTIRPRLDAAGADVARVHILRAAQAGQGGRALNLQDDLIALSAFLADHPHVRLVCVDPLTAYLGETDSHRNAGMRALLDPLGALAAQAGVALVAVSHLNKAGYGGSSLYRVSGSLALVAAARASYLVARDPADPDRRLLLPSKNNLGQDATGLAWRIAPGHNGAPRLEWESRPVTLTADQALGARPRNHGPEHSEFSEASAWLKELLAEGAMPARQLKQQATRAGLAWRTVQRAMKPAGAISVRQGFGREATYVWRLQLPATDPCPPTQNLGAQGAQGAHDPSAPPPTL